MVFHPVFNGITFLLCWIHLSSQATYQTIELTSSVDVETSNPDLLIIGLKQLPVNSHFNILIWKFKEELKHFIYDL